MAKHITFNDHQISAAIQSCRPFEYLENLKKDVAQKLGITDADERGPQDFGMRVYTLNRAIEEAERKAGYIARGYQYATPEVMKSLEGKPAIFAHGSDDVLGTVIPDGRGGLMFLPKGQKKKGYRPEWIKPAPADARPMAVICADPAERTSYGGVSITIGIGQSREYMRASVPYKTAGDLFAAMNEAAKKLISENPARAFRLTLRLPKGARKPKGFTDADSTLLFFPGEPLKWVGGASVQS